MMALIAETHILKCINQRLSRLTAETKNLSIMKTTYTHQIGVIAVEGWGNPFLVVTENRFYNGEEMSYTYRKLGVSFETEETAKHEALVLNSQLSTMKEFNRKEFTPAQSEKFLLKLQAMFPNAEIARHTKAQPSKTLSVS